MTKLSEIIQTLPVMKSGEELIAALTVLPEYDPAICTADATLRLMALSDLYRVYIPSQMSLEIYSKLYLALLRSLQKKGTKLAVQQQNHNFRAIIQQEYSGIMGGSDSFTIIGASGIGKSSAISRAISLITENKMIEVDNPYTKIIPCICVQCPFDSSVKGLLLEILRKVGECIDGKYYHNALRVRSTTDMLIGSVSQVALNHIGLLVADEIQNVVNSKNGKSLVGMLTQLINNSGISICMVGTPESSIFFEQTMQLARRSLGLRYEQMECGANFKRFCEVLFSYQYVRNKTEITDAIAPSMNRGTHASQSGSWSIFALSSLDVPSGTPTVVCLKIASNCALRSLRVEACCICCYARLSSEGVPEGTSSESNAAERQMLQTPPCVPLSIEGRVAV